MPRTSLRAPVLRAAVVAATASAALVTMVPATTPTHPAATPIAAAPTPAAGAPAAAPVANPLFPPPARVAVPAPAAPIPTVEVAVQPVLQATPTVASGSATSRALSKIGAPYRWGATGPNAFDCSGLVTWAYKASGVSLPRTSRAMSRVGTAVSKAELRPGDLVFFYRPVSHVGIYIGNGKIVHASSRKSPVKVSDMARMKFNSARRV